MENKADWAVFVYETQQEAWDLTKEAASTQDNDTLQTLCTYFDEGQRSPGVAKPLSCPAVRSEARGECFGSSATVRNDIVWLAHHARQVLSQAEWTVDVPYLPGLLQGLERAARRRQALCVDSQVCLGDWGGWLWVRDRQAGLGTLNLDLQMLEQYVQFRQAQTLLAQQHWPPRGPAEVDAFLARLRQEIEEAKTRPKG
eukprot:g55411.t1